MKKALSEQEKRKEWDKHIKSAREKSAALAENYEKENVVHYQNNEFNTSGVIVLNVITNASKTIRDERLPEIIEHLRYFGATDTVFFFRFSRLKYTGWIAWRGKCYKCFKEYEGYGGGPAQGGNVYSFFSDGLRHLFTLIDRARKVNYLEELLHKYKKSLETSDFT